MKQVRTPELSGCGCGLDLGGQPALRMKEAERGKQVLTGVREAFSLQGRRELGLEER